MGVNKTDASAAPLSKREAASLKQELVILLPHARFVGIVFF
jgi:hypothetical protein